MKLCLSGFWMRSGTIWILVLRVSGPFHHADVVDGALVKFPQHKEIFQSWSWLNKKIRCRQSVRGWKGTVKYGADSRSSSLTCFRFVKSPVRHALCHYRELYYISPKQTSTPFKNHLQHRALNASGLHTVNNRRSEVNSGSQHPGSQCNWFLECWFSTWGDGISWRSEEMKSSSRYTTPPSY